MASKKQKKKAVHTDNKNKKNDTRSRLPVIEDKLTGKLLGLSNPYLEISLLSLLIALAGFVLYFNTTDTSLVYCDDNIFVQRFTKDIPLSSTIDTTVGTTFYRPILNASFILDAKIATPENASVDQRAVPPDERKPLENIVNCGIYHRTNLIFHLLGSILVFLALIKLRFPISLSFFLALIFTVHPILAPAVSWISGRNDSMITVFILISFIFFINYMQSEKKGLMYLYLFLHLFFFVISLYTKEIGIVFPFISLIYIPYFLFFRHDKKDVKFKTYLVIPFWGILGIIWYSMRSAAMAKIQSPDEIGLDAFIKNFNTIPAMIGKIFIPYKMIALSSFESFSIITGWIFIALIIGIYIYFTKTIQKGQIFRKTYKILWGFAWYVVFLVPSLMIRIQYVDDFFDYAEHRAYLPMFGILVIIASFIFIKKINVRKPLPIIIFLLIAGVFGVRSYFYKDSFKDRKAFWGRMVEMYPEKSRGYYDLALATKASGDTTGAVKLYYEAMQRNPKNKKIYYELMGIYDKRGQNDSTLAMASKLLSFEPNNSLGKFFYGKALYSMGNKIQAIPYLESATRYNSQFPQWFVYLGGAYLANNQIDQSIKALEHSLSYGISYPEAYLYLGMDYDILNQHEKANQMWEKAISQQPSLYLQILEYYDKHRKYNDVKMLALKAEKKFKNPASPHYYFLAKAYLNTNEVQTGIVMLENAIKKYPGDRNLYILLGDAYLKTGQADKAETIYKNLLKNNPGDVDGNYFLGNTYAYRKEYDKAIAQYEKAIKLSPGYSPAYNSLATVYFETGKFNKAEQMWLQSIKADPHHYKSYSNLIRYYLNRKDVQSAKKIAAELKKNGGSLSPKLQGMLSN